MTKTEVSVILCVFLTGLLNMAWGASVRTQLPSLDDVVGADLAVKLDPSYRSPESAASSVSLSPLVSPLRTPEGSSTFTFDELPAAAHTELPATPGKSDGILLKSPPRRASFGGRLGSPSGGQSSKPPRARPRVQSHPAARAEEPTHESISPDVIAKFVRLISDFENAASVNARGRYNQFLFLTDRSSDIAQWVGSNPNKVFQMYYYGTVQNVTQSLDCPLVRKSGSPHIDWRAISLQALHESLLSSFPFRSPRADFAFTDQARVVLTRINKNRPSEYLTQVVAIISKLNNSRLISHPATARTIPRFVALLIRVIEGQLIDPRFIEMLLTVLNVTIRLWSKISHESTASFYIDLLADVYTRYMSSLEYMALWVSDGTADDSEVDRLLTIAETATGEIYARIFQIENVIDTLPRIESYFSTLFENIPGEIFGARTSRSVPFLYSLFAKLSPDQLEDYLTLVPKLTSERVRERASIVEFLSLNFLLENEDSSGNWLKIADQLTKTKTNGPYRLDTDMRNHWLNRHDDEDGGACKTTTDFELVGLVVNGSILMRTKNLSRDLIEKWKVLIRQLASFVNNPEMTLQDTFTISTLIPARNVVRQMLNYEEAV